MVFLRVLWLAAFATVVSQTVAASGGPIAFVARGLIPRIHQAGKDVCQAPRLLPAVSSRRTCNLFFLKMTSPEQWISGDSTVDPADGFAVTPERVAGWAGTDRKQAYAHITACDAMMQENYAKNHAEVGKTIYPFLFCEFTPDGGRYTLLVNESERWSEKPVHQTYEDVKSVSHIPMGIWVTLSRYLQSSDPRVWQPLLTEYEQIVQMVFDSLDELKMSDSARKSCRHVLKASLRFIGQTTKKDSINQKKFQTDFREYTLSIEDDLVNLQTIAAQTQVCGLLSTLTKWKHKIGKEEWKKLYAVAPAQWTLSTENVHQLIVASTMEEEQAASNIFVPSDPSIDLDAARALVGRVVGDRVLAQDVFPGSSEAAHQNVYSLSTSRDLLSQAAEQVLEGERLQHFKDALNRLADQQATMPACPLRQKREGECPAHK
mmetsp:Transcript_39793/g.79755  ORF Transcript_39793/g.79755 Transcript_39793/m.79755 type:complete len:432 (-) Transcript_39793:166-1461(-)